MEWLKDFAIRQAGAYVSLHQVKAKSEADFSKYSLDIGIMIAKVLGVVVAPLKAEHFSLNLREACQ